MQLVTIKIASERLMVKTSTLYSWVRNGSIPFHRLNSLIRFDLDELEAWVGSSRQDRKKPSACGKNLPPQSIDKIIRQAIDSSKTPRYNPSNGKPGRHQGLGEED